MWNSCGESAPEDANRIARDLGEEPVDLRRRVEVLVAVEPALAVGPVERPDALRLREPKPCDLLSDPLAPELPSHGGRHSRIVTARASTSISTRPSSTSSPICSIWSVTHRRTRARSLSGNGSAAFGQDSTNDPWYPVGNGNMMNILDNGIHLAQTMSFDELDRCLDLVPTTEQRRWARRTRTASRWASPCTPGARRRLAVPPYGSGPMRSHRAAGVTTE